MTSTNTASCTRLTVSNKVRRFVSICRTFVGGGAAILNRDTPGLRRRLQTGDQTWGAWLNLASPLSAELMASLGFDWVCIDMEHGPGDMFALQSQLQAIGNAPQVTPIVRIVANDPALIKRVLDLGADGIVVPSVDSRDEARAAVGAVCYPPKGRRGVARASRATRFGMRFQDYYQAANDQILVVTQIESQAGVDEADAIASVEGIDVLFVGPLDLSTDLGVQGNLKSPEFQRALQTIETAARAHRKTLGVAAANDRMAAEFRERGYRFISLSSETSLLVEAADNLLATVKRQTGEGAK